MSTALAAGSVGGLRAALADLDPAATPAAWLERLVRQGHDRLPLPGAGATLQRWQSLSAVAEHDLSLAKLYEGHVDALAIQAEVMAASGLDGECTWGTWAAESPEGRCIADAAADGGLTLSGAKHWCSGAATVSHGLLTAWYADGRGPQLVRVAMRQPGVEVRGDAWRAVGMAGSQSLDVRFRGAKAERVGDLGVYLTRPGFQHGGAGIAACWYGGALSLAGTLRRSLAQAAPTGRGPWRLAALGRIDVALQGTAALLRQTACWIDAHPADDASAVAARVRLSAETCAHEVLDEAGRALGAYPYCRDAQFARAAADLPVFVRQSHGDRDFASLGERLVTPGPGDWIL